MFPEVSIPLKLETFFRLTSRLGEVMPCLSEVTRSVPPARISTAPARSSKRPIALSRSVGLAYSKEFIPGLPLLTLPGRDRA